MKKTLTRVITFVLAISVVFASTATASAASIKINKSKVTLYENQTVKLKIVNTSKKVTWGSSKKSVATVAANGRVTAKKAGVATITGKVNGKKYKCKVTVKEASGSRQKPANPKKGVTITGLTGGKYYYNLNNVYRYQDAVEQLKNTGGWDMWGEYYYNNKEAGTDLLLMEFDVKAISGFENDPLDSSDVIGGILTKFYNEQATIETDEIESLLLVNSQLNVSLFNGGTTTMYYCALIPNDMNTFTTYNNEKGFDKFWVKYEV